MEAPFKAILTQLKGRFVRIERDMLNEEEVYRWGWVKEVDDSGCILHRKYSEEERKEKLLHYSEECWFYAHRDIRSVHWDDSGM